VSGRFSQTGYSYTVGPRVSAQRPLRTSSTELLHISIAAIVLTVDFILLDSMDMLFPSNTELLIVGTSVGAALTAFVCHELAHKISAQRRGYWAEFRFSPFGLIVSLFTAYFGFLWAAPGATVIGGMSNPDDCGRTSLAGPATNFVFAILFFGSSVGISALFPSEVNFSGALLFLAYINGWFGAFNMIPIGPLDGAKVWRWSKLTWAIAFVVFGGLAAYLFYLFYILGL
jgi:Zn-dependent protease